ncbi:MAG TPA: YcxB family protein [Tepidisphaeraceae bacterium]|jgi:hypothetical protein
MRITYELTEKDYLEAVAAVRRGEVGRGKRRLPVWMGWLSAGLFAAVCIAGLTLALNDIWQQQEGDLNRIADRIAEPAPWLVLCLVLFLCLAALKVGRAAGFALIGLAFVLVVAVGSFVVFWRTGAAEVGWLPWFVLAMMCITSLMAVTQRGRRTKSLWARQPHLHRPKTLTWANGRLELADSLASYSCDFELIKAWGETANLFLVMLTAGFHIVPKRAFASEHDIEAFRQDLMIVTKSRARGFEVVPMQNGQPPQA